jgi:hypothetical protein
VFLQRVALKIHCPNNEESRPDDDQSGGSFLNKTDGVVDAFRIIPWKMAMYAEPRHQEETFHGPAFLSSLVWPALAMPA